MIDKRIIKTIRDKEMNRKDFLKYSGIFLLSVVGFKLIVALLNQSEDKLIGSKNESSRGFGGGKYGS